MLRSSLFERTHARREGACFSLQIRQPQEENERTPPWTGGVCCGGGREGHHLVLLRVRLPAIKAPLNIIVEHWWTPGRIKDGEFDGLVHRPCRFLMILPIPHSTHHQIRFSPLPKSLVSRTETLFGRPKAVLLRPFFDCEWEAMLK